MNIEIEGTITIDGVIRQFFVGNKEFSWQQWGESSQELGKSVFLLDAIQQALFEECGS